MEKVKVSILCLTFNHEKYIGEALDGFLSQKVDFTYEIVVHDDASTDSTRKIIDEYYENNPTLIKRIYPEANIHSSGGNVLKNALDSCSGEYIAFCEGDDKWVDSNKLKSQVDFLDSNKEFVLVYSDCIPFNEQGPLKIDLYGTKRNLEQDELIRSPSIYTLTTCFRNVIKIPPEASIARYGDLFMWTLLGQYGKGAYLETKKPPMYRMHVGGMHSMKNRHLKFEMLISTYSAINMYYRRTGRDSCAITFRNLIVISTLRYFVVNVLIKLKIYGLLKFLRKVYTTTSDALRVG